MSAGGPIGRRFRQHVPVLTLLLSGVGYALVAVTFLGPSPFPPLSEEATVLFGDLIAIVNAGALASIVAGVHFIRRRAIRRHRAAMVTAFVLILVFLLLYLWKVGGGFEKAIVIEATHPLGTHAGLVRGTYLVMLAVHVLLSAVSVPVVLHAVLLGLTHTPDELERTRHATVGRIAAAVWSLSLALGLITYLMLNHVYAWVPR
jgi:putative membrane protein